MAIADEKIREIKDEKWEMENMVSIKSPAGDKNKEGITLYPGMAGMTRDIIEKMKKEGVELLSVDIMVTQKCNFRCSYCYASAGPDKLHEFTMKEAKDIVQQCIELGVRIINMQGGEPTFWNPSDWEGEFGWALIHLLEYVRSEYQKKKIPLYLVTFTDVALMTPEKAKKLYDLSVGLCCKLDSLEPDIQDGLLCVKGGHAKMMEGYKHLINAGYGKEGSPTISTNSVVTMKNHKGIADVFRWSRNNGFKPFVIPVHVHGRAKDKRDIMLDRTLGENKSTLSPIDIKNLFEKLSEIDAKEFDIHWEPLTPWVENKACSRHLGGIHIRSDGVVVPCSEAPDAWALGDIRKRELKEIVRDSKVKKFRNIYSELHNNSKCNPKNCEIAAQNLVTKMY